ncbi:DUF3772 domain-containing protein [Labrys monachus]|uniref:Small-conductance mechanosensitive channel n=1 Tax=Labrys monachus TaxID=217067 RepID=A0ABU0FPC8_9HYPH|nr:DUF3772 domain-containing protein [Labrys monachus]MDQ0396316.1 small-conductance mechanosensitive channel [Labrys monachus]
MHRFVSRFAAFWCLLLALLVAPLAASAQDSSAAAFQNTLTQDRKELDEVASGLATVKDDGDAAQLTLQRLRESVSRVRTDLVTLQSNVLAVRDSHRASFDKIGPPPKPADPPESKDVTEARSREQATLDQLSGVMTDIQDQVERADTLANLIIVQPFLMSFNADKKALDDVEASLASIASAGDSASQTLQDLRAKIDAARTDLTTVQTTVIPLRDASQSRLKKLGPEPKPTDPPESKDITDTRRTENALFTQLAEIVTKTQYQAARADDLANAVTEYQRELITGRLLKGGDSVFSRSFWKPVIRKAPEAVLRAKDMAVTSALHFTHAVNSTSIAIFLLTIAAGYVVAQFLRYRIMRWQARLPRKKKTSRRYVASLDAVLGLVYTMLRVPCAVCVAVLAFRFSSLLPVYVIDEFGWDFIRATLVGFGLWALARAILAKEHSDLRLLPLSDWAVRRIGRRMGWMALVLGVSQLLDGFIKSLHADASLTVARDAVTASLFIIITCSLLIRLRSAPPTVVNGQVLSPDEDINALDILRPISWVAVFVMGVCLIAGYTALAVAAAVLPLLLICIIAASYLLTTLVDSALTDNLLGDTERRRAISRAVGISSKNVSFSATLLSGILRLVIIVAAVLTLGAPFGFYSADMLPAVQRAYFGFQIGEMTISPSSILAGIFLFVTIWGVTRLIRGWMSNTLLPRTTLDAGLQNSIATIVGYVGVIMAISASLSEIGLSLQNIAYVASALAVGIGFGLQAIVNNFVSGLILLAERPIRVGDIIAASGEEGFVRRISVRATEIETFDRATLIVPNSLLITGVVKNWVYGNTWSRLRIVLSLGYDADVDAVRAAMLGAAEDDPRILPSPAPRVFLSKLGDAALEFELVVVLASMETQPAVKSDLLIRILKAFRAKGIRMVAQLPAVPPPVVVSLEEALGVVEVAKMRGDKPAAPPPASPPANKAPPAAAPATKASP